MAALKPESTLPWKAPYSSRVSLQGLGREVQYKREISKIGNSTTFIYFTQCKKHGVKTREPQSITAVQEALKRMGFNQDKLKPWWNKCAFHCTFLGHIPEGWCHYRKGYALSELLPYIKKWGAQRGPSKEDMSGWIGSYRRRHAFTYPGSKLYQALQVKASTLNWDQKRIGSQ